ncbi:hypothetical protein ACQJBY_004115 [Aegilops geniculata]
MGGSKRGLESAIVCLLVLGLVLEQVQVEGVDCGANPFKVACFNSCLLGPSTVFQCADFCACRLPAGLASLRSSADNTEEMKLYVKRCGDACDSFCKGDTLLASLDG